MKKLQYVVTGTGRSGSVYMARLLTSVGVPCAHEGIFNRFGVENAMDMLEHPEKIRTSLVSGDSWLPPGKDIVADSSYMAAPYLEYEFLRGTHVIHGVRHPLRVVSSFVKDLKYFFGTKVNTSYETFIYRSIPELYQEMTQIERACVFYTRWNTMIEKSKLACDSLYFRFRVEDQNDGLLKFLGVDKEKIGPDGVFNYRKANTMKTGIKPFKLNDIPKGEIKDEFIEMGQRYGYEMDLKSKLF